MIISLKALTKLLLFRGHRFTIEPTKEKHFDGRNVVVFYVSKSYPETGHHVTWGDMKDREAISTEKWRTGNQGRVLLHYDMDTDTMLGAACDVYDMVKQAKKTAISKSLETETNDNTNAIQTSNA